MDREFVIVDRTWSVVEQKKNQIPLLDDKTERGQLLKSCNVVKQRIPACVYICTVFAAVDSFAIGYNLAVVSGAMILIK